jgi:hypothetical protein
MNSQRSALSSVFIDATTAYERAGTELRKRARRLGTAAELPDDFDRVRALAHELQRYHGLIAVTSDRLPPMESGA